MEENQKICKILEEFCLYLLEEEIEVLNMSIKRNEKKVSITYECDSLSEETLEELTDIFKVKREESFEVYGWELIGNGDMDHELTLVSSLIDYFTYYLKDGKVYFNLVRYEK